MIGHAAHGNRLFGVLIPGGERYLEFAGGGDGVFEEKLVKIA